MARLGDAIRRLRSKKGMNQAELGKAVFLSRSTISDYENGATPIDSDTIKKLDSTLEAEGLLTDLWTLATSGNYSTEHVASREAKAVRIQAWDNRLFPGLLQTPDYARYVMRAARPFDADERIEHDVAQRAKRQEIWQRENPPTGWFVFCESVLYRPFGGTEVMRTQIDNVLAMAAMPQVFVQVMRFSATSQPGNEGPLHIMHYPASSPAVYTEGWYTGRTIDAEGEVQAYMTYFDLICASALAPKRSTEFIVKVRDTRYAQ